MSEHAVFSAGSLLRALVEGRVRFVVIGGLAAQAHGSPLITEDLDICFDLERDNLERLASVLADLTAIRRGLPDGVVAPVDARALRSGDMFTLRTRFGDLDLLARPDPALDYASLASRAIAFEFHPYGCPDPDPEALAQRMLREAGYAVSPAHLESLPGHGMVWAWKPA